MDHMAGAVEFAANRLACTAKMVRKKRLRDGHVRQPVRRLLETKPFVGIDGILFAYMAATIELLSATLQRTSLAP
jgi:hypothetical protein